MQTFNKETRMELSKIADMDLPADLRLRRGWDPRRDPGAGVVGRV